ncbi:MAG: AAA family ATPase [Deltaproteobacteria bacterium]|nr:AAA family ATPase [Deltaproteobacteria bacterium]
MYLEYWHLQKPPFDNVPDPSMYAECHTSMENAIAETLFAIEEGNECLSVIIGDVGLGKTLSLRIIIDSLPPEKYQMALVTNPSISFNQLLNEIIGQLTETPSNEKKKVALLEKFNKLLFQASDQGKKIVVFIDEANAIAPANLESLRLLTNMQDDRRNLFTLVLAGQIELARRLEDPKRANLFQRIGTYSRIDKVAPLDQLQAYVETRLRLAGATKSIFTGDTYPIFWEYSDQGVPRLINKIAKLSLKAGETYDLEQIDGQIVYQVGRQFERISGSVSSRGKSKKKKQEPICTEPYKPFFDQGQADPGIEGQGEKASAWKETRSEEVLTETPFISGPERSEALNREPVINPDISTETTPEALDGLKPKGEGLLDSFQVLTLPFPQTKNGERTSLPIRLEKVEERFPSGLDTRFKSDTEVEAVGLIPEDFRSTGMSDDSSFQTNLSEVTENNPPASEGIFEEIQVGKFKVRLHLPSQFVEQALSSNMEVRFRMAGQAAVNAIKKFSQLTSSPPDDPVSTWSELRSIIFKRLTPSESEMTIL